MNRPAILAALLAATVAAPMAQAVDLSLDLNLASVHTEQWARDSLNQRNEGLGLTAQLDPAWSLSVGEYRNSYRRTSAYALAAWTPLRVPLGNWRWALRQRLASVRDALVEENPTAADGWLAARGGPAFRERGALVSRLARRAAFAHAHQDPPPFARDGKPWTTWLVLAGRGAGKTRLGAEWVRALVHGEGPYAAQPHGAIARLPNLTEQRIIIRQVECPRRRLAASAAHDATCDSQCARERGRKRDGR